MSINELPSHPNSNNCNIKGKIFIIHAPVGALKVIRVILLFKNTSCWIFLCKRELFFFFLAEPINEENLSINEALSCPNSNDLMEGKIL